MILTSFNPVIRLATNTTGRDFVCGDLHGCLDDLLVAMDRLGFDKTKDRMFSVGDLIDRGPKSFETANLIYEPWMYVSRGNHEQMMIDSVIGDNTRWISTWLYNGGDWYINYETWQIRDLANDLNKLPYIITVGEGDTQFNVVHAEIAHRNMQNKFVPVTSDIIDSWSFLQNDIHNMLWGRNMVSRDHAEGSGISPPFHDKTLPLTIAGHTVVNKPLQIERQVYIDTGTVYQYVEIIPGAGLTIAEPNAQKFYRFSKSSTEMVEYTLDDAEILKYRQ